MSANRDHEQRPVEISWLDALRLATRFWPALVFIPLVAMAASTAIYMSFPAPSRATAALNTTGSNVRKAISEIETGVPDVTISYEEVSAGSILLSAQALDSDIALQAVQSIVERVPANVGAASELTLPQLLEVRALRQYLKVLRSKLAAGLPIDEVEPELLQQEINVVELRLRALEASNTTAEAVPLIARAPSVVPARTPPTRNVVFFSLVATLFFVWLVIYGAELRRINRLPVSA
jgi:hypothetical protein